MLSSSAFNKENRRAPSNEKEELALRERLAQAIDTIAHKDAEIKRLNDGKSTSNEERRLLEREMEGLRRDLADRDTRLVHKQAEIVNLQSKMQELERSLTEQQLSEELAKNQLKYYEMEQDKFKRAIQEVFHRSLRRRRTSRRSARSPPGQTQSSEKTIGSKQTLTGWLSCSHRKIVIRCSSKWASARTSSSATWGSPTRN